MTHEERAIQAFKKGANCAQAVVVAYVDDLNLDDSTALKLASSFGGGIGRMREVCGAVSGMLMVFGLLKGYETIDDQNVKKEHYANVQSLVNQFRDQHGSFICRELLSLKNGENTAPVPTERTEQFYHARPCTVFVQTAVRILDEFLNHQ